MVEMKAKALRLDTIFQGVGLIYVLLFLFVLAVVLAKSKTNRARWTYGALITFGFGLLPYWIFIYETPKQRASRIAQETKQAEWRTSYARGKALFEEKCKTAGERIYKTVENVEGVLLQKIRLPRGSDAATLNEPMWPDAALAKEHTADLYIEHFLTDRKEVKVGHDKTNAIMGRRIVGDVGSPGAERGLRYVDVDEPAVGKRFRYTATVTFKPPFHPDVKLHAQPTTAAPPRYAVTFENNVDPELRKYWVAGTTVKVIDTKTNETLGELEVWKFGPTMGMDTQGTGWGTSARDCPEPPFGQYGEQTHYFVEKILKAKQGK